MSRIKNVLSDKKMQAIFSIIRFKMRTFAKKFRTTKNS